MAKSTPRTPKRKIVQIATLVATPKYDDALYALADDGTLWHRALGLGRTGAWNRIENIPQPVNNVTLSDELKDTLSGNIKEETK